MKLTDFFKCFNLPRVKYDIKLDGTYDFLIEMQAFWESINQHLVSYYPSSGDDVTDVNLYLDHPLFTDKNIQIFLRSDFLETDLPFKSELADGLANRFEVLNALTISVSSWDLQLRNRKPPSISIYKLKVKSGDKFIYVVHFGAFYNEEVLQILIESNIKTAVVFAKCDGIWWGQGNFYYPKQITTYLFPLFQEILKMEYIISDKTNTDIITRLSAIDGGVNNKSPLIDVINTYHFTPNKINRQGADLLANTISRVSAFREIQTLSNGLILKQFT